ncbi:MAG: hypothetical protein ACI9HK_006242 [Pirellulaceae bacterium]|jgi:hypothetical protein
MFIHDDKLLASANVPKSNGLVPRGCSHLASIGVERQIQDIIRVSLAISDQLNICGIPDP